MKMAKLMLTPQQEWTYMVTTRIIYRTRWEQYIRANWYSITSRRGYLRVFIRRDEAIALCCRRMWDLIIVMADLSSGAVSLQMICWLGALRAQSLVIGSWSLTEVTLSWGKSRTQFATSNVWKRGKEKRADVEALHQLIFVGPSRKAISTSKVTVVQDQGKALFSTILNAAMNWSGERFIRQSHTWLIMLGWTTLF